MKTSESLNDTLNDLLKYPLMEAIAGRRSRRFCMGAEISDGVLAFKSKHNPVPLSEIEQLLILSTKIRNIFVEWNARDKLFEFFIKL
jgi:hypothetical protein